MAKIQSLGRLISEMQAVARREVADLADAAAVRASSAEAVFRLRL